VVSCDTAATNTTTTLGAAGTRARQMHDRRHGRVPDPQARRVASVKLPRFVLPGDSAEAVSPNELQ
jgi:hypothetical protein